MPEQSEEFKEAVKSVEAFTKKPTNDELLKLYGLYKHGTNEKSIDDTAAPGTFDFKGKAKYKAYSDVVHSGMSPADAQSAYVDYAKELSASYA